MKPGRDSFTIWSLYYGPVLLARFDEREMKFYA
jgi:hypothetical protein